MVTFKAPLALSEYRFSARGVTGSDTLVGQSTADLAVRKDFFVDLKRPAALAEGDKPRFAAQLHHSGVVGKVAVRLTVYAGGRERVMPRELEIKGDGVEELLFDPFEIPDGDNVRLTLSAKSGDAGDEETVEVPIRPWGVQATASASGTSSDSTTAFIGLPPGRAYEEPEMLVVVSPTLKRLLVELALGRDAYPFDRRMAACFPLPANTVADRAGDLLAACSALEYLRTQQAVEAPEFRRLTDRMHGLVSELITLQNDDGGWPWVAGEGPGARPSDRLTSARVLWALRGAWGQAAMTDPKTVDKAVAHLQGEFAKLDAADQETRAALLHALGAWGKATFEQANALNRDRQNLPDAALAYLALTFADLDRGALAGEGPRRPRAPGQDGSRWPRQEGSPLLGRGEPEALAPIDGRDDCPGRPRLRPHPTRRPRTGRRRRLAAGPPRRHRLAARQGQGTRAGRPLEVLRRRQGRRGPVQLDRHRQ